MKTHCETCGRKFYKKRPKPKLKYKTPSKEQRQALFKLAYDFVGASSKHPKDISWSKLERFLKDSPRKVENLGLNSNFNAASLKRQWRQFAETVIRKQ